VKRFSSPVKFLALVGVVLVLCTITACKKKTPTQQTPTLTDVSLSSATVAGGSAVQGTVTLSAAPSSVTSVSLSSNSASATVPGSVSVAAGATSAAFTVNTSTVAAEVNASISGTFSGTTISKPLKITPPALAANFTVTSLSASFRKRDNSNGQTPDPNPVQILPAGTADACPVLKNGGNQILDCRFDGSTSTSPTPISQYVWTYSVGQSQKTEATTTPQLVPTASGCFFAGQGNGTTGGGLTFISMKVDLQVKDSGGTLSAVKSSQNIRIFPAGECGYGF
jgi:hypothetical protein